jgi:hypothetical protein
VENPGDWPANDAEPKADPQCGDFGAEGRRLHLNPWAELDDLLLDDFLAEAAQLLTRHTAPEPVYPAIPGPREASPCLTSKRLIRTWPRPNACRPQPGCRRADHRPL